MIEGASVPGVRRLERRLDRLSALAEERVRERARLRDDLGAARGFLDLAPGALETLEELSTALFGEILDEIEENLTYAIQEVLGQDRTVVTQREVKGGRLNVSFLICNPSAGEPDGERLENLEDIMTGQGGSVANILSVGLRLIALSQLDAGRHRPFLVLDEQDCWLKPELVPTFMGLVRQIADRLKLQVLVISHHPLDLFSNAANTIYGLRPDRERGVAVEVLKSE